MSPGKKVQQQSFYSAKRTSQTKDSILQGSQAVWQQLKMNNMYVITGESAQKMKEEVSTKHS